MNPAMKTIISSHTAIQILNGGGVGVMPTDTVYGLVARAHDPKAVARLYALKNRTHKPGTIIAANTEQLIKLGVEERHINKVKRWWPGPVSVIFPVNPRFAYLHQGLGDMPIRIVADERVRKILEQTGPLATSSANQPGKPSAVTVTEAWNYFHNTIDFYVDGGDLSDRTSSTIIKLTEGGGFQTIREGTVNLSI